MNETYHNVLRVQRGDSFPKVHLDLSVLFIVFEFEIKVPVFSVVQAHR